jgi:hypothetical protein
MLAAPLNLFGRHVLELDRAINEFDQSISADLLPAIATGFSWQPRFSW